MIQHLERRRHKLGGSTKYYIDCVKYGAKNASDIQIDGILQENNDAAVLHAVVQNIQKTDTIVVKIDHIVVKIDRADKTNRKEYDYGELFYRRHIPGFIRYMCICQVESNLDYVLVMPYFPEGSIRTYAWTEDNIPILKCLLMQVVASMLMAYTTVGYVHDDLHTDNILIRTTEKTEIVYKILDREITVPTFGYEAVIMDFAKSFVGVDQSRFFWFDILNVLLRTSLDLEPSDHRKLIWKCQASSIISIIESARYSDAPPEEALHILDKIQHASFYFMELPSSPSYKPNRGVNCNVVIESIGPTDKG